MLIKKSFEVTLSGAYQSYKFSTSIEREINVNPDDTDAVNKASDDLMAVVIDIVEKDIEAYKLKDDKFKTVLNVRADALTKAAKTLSS